VKNKTRDHVAMEERRLKACALFQKDICPAEVARRLGVRRQSAHDWFQKWKTGGASALRSRGSAGRKPRLSAAQKEQIAQALVQGAAAHGYDNELWTLPRVAQLVRELTGVRYHPGHVWHLLRSMGMSCQKPERRAVEQDPEKVRRWKRYQWPAIKKKPVARAEPTSSSTKAG